MVTIKEQLARGGKLPGQKGFNRKEIEKQVAKKKLIRDPELNRSKPKRAQGPVGPSKSKPVQGPETKEQADIRKFGKVQEEKRSIFDPSSRDEALANPLKTLGELTGINNLGVEHFAAAIGLADLNGAIGSVVTNTLTKTLGRIGTLTIGRTGTSSASKIAVNTKTQKQTASWLNKLLTTTSTVTRVNTRTGKSSTFVVSKAGQIISTKTIIAGFLASVGSFPFAGFIKEEALQSLEYGTSAAMKDLDREGFDESMALREEILKPDLMGKILNGVPYGNIINNLKKYYEAAMIKVDIDKRIFANMILAEETNTTENDLFEQSRDRQREADKEADIEETERFEASTKRRLADEEAASIRETERIEDSKTKGIAEAEAADNRRIERQRIFWEESQKQELEHEQALSDQYAANALQLQKLQEEADDRDQKEDAAFWAKEREKQREKEAEDREAIAAFWLNYKKQALKIQEDSRPSKLNFGLI